MKTIYEVDDSRTAQIEAQRIGGSVIARIAGTLYDVDERGAVHALGITECARIESGIALKAIEVVRRPAPKDDSLLCVLCGRPENDRSIIRGAAGGFVHSECAR